MKKGLLLVESSYNPENINTLLTALSKNHMPYRFWRKNLANSYARYHLYTIKFLKNSFSHCHIIVVEITLWFKIYILILYKFIVFACILWKFHDQSKIVYFELIA